MRLPELIDPLLKTKLERVYDPGAGVMHVVAFASGSGTNFREAVLESEKEESNFSIDLLITDRETRNGRRIGALDLADSFGIPYVALNGFRFCGSWKEAQKTEGGRQEYEERSLAFNQALVEIINDYEDRLDLQFGLAVLAGYMRLVKAPLLERFPMQMINVHPADLTIPNEEGTGRKYVGDNAVYDALVDGNDRTRSSIILVDERVDGGPLLVSGPWVDYAGSRPVTQELADEHQEKQKEQSDWPALRFALRGIANGMSVLHKTYRFFDDNPLVFWNGNEMNYSGYDMGKMGGKPEEE